MCDLFVHHTHDQLLELTCFHLLGVYYSVGGCVGWTLGMDGQMPVVWPWLTASCGLEESW